MLIVSRLQQPTDFTADQANLKIIPLNVKTKWEGPFFYEPPKGDLKKDWLVWIKYQHPVTGEYERFRYNVGFNDLGTKELRRQHGRALMIIIDELLKEGWSPFEDFSVFNKYKDKSVVKCIDVYLTTVEPDLRPNTFKKYFLELNVFKRYLIDNQYDDLLISQVKKSLVTTFLQETKALRKWTGKTYNHYLNDITTFFNYFHHNYDDYLTSVPITHLKRQPVERPGNLAYNDWQFKKLQEMMLEKGDIGLYNFCSLIYYCCLRNEAEANKIRIWDFNFKADTLRIESGTAKNRKTEYIPLYPETKEFLLSLGVDKLPGELYLFGRGDVIGGPLPVGNDYYARKFRYYKKALNLSKRHGIYPFKHTRNVHLGEDGEDLYNIMKLNRHSNLAMTMVYMQDLGINVRDIKYDKGRKFQSISDTK